MNGVSPFFVCGIGKHVFLRQDENDHVYVIRHDAIGVDNNVVIMLRDLPDCGIDDSPVLR
jgi:hypothetical protein